MICDYFYTYIKKIICKSQFIIFDRFNIIFIFLENTLLFYIITYALYYLSFWLIRCENFQFLYLVNFLVSLFRLT